MFEGDLSIILDDSGNITDISGIGYPNFPDTGNFRSINRGFNWSRVKSRIENKKGAYYKETYNTDLPLNDDTRYLHFRVFDPEKGDRYELKSFLNETVYSYFDFYVDPKDPAVFFKLSIVNPTKIVNNKLGKALINKILKKASAETLETLSKVEDMTYSFGFSNQGNFYSRSYEFSNREDFQEVYGITGIESKPAHIYQRFENIPIPRAIVFRYSGEGFTHFGPEVLKSDEDNWSDFLNSLDADIVDYTYTGSIDFGRKGIALILGALPGLNPFLGRPRLEDDISLEEISLTDPALDYITYDFRDDDIFSEDFNIDAASATAQVSIGLLENISVRQDKWSIGAEYRVSFMNQIFAEDKRFVDFFDESEFALGFLFITLGPEEEDWSIFMQQIYTIRTGLIKGIKTNGYIFIRSEEGEIVNMTLKGSVKEKLGPLYVGLEIIGQYEDIIGWSFSTLLNENITLRNGVVLYEVQLETAISLNEGITFEGFVDYPFGIVSANTKGQLVDNGGELFVSLESQFSGYIILPGGTQIGTDGSGFKIRTSDNPDEDLIVEGYITLSGHDEPIYVEGSLGNNLNLNGLFQGNVNFNGVQLFTNNGQVTISDTDGVLISGDFELPDGLGMAKLEGSYTNDGFELEGSMGSSIVIDGHQFAFANSYVKASSLIGVQISGNLDLYAFKINVTGSVNPDKSFLLKGTRNLNTNKLEAETNVRVTQNGISFGPNTGCIKLPLNQEACGSLEFNPNWNRQEISVCRGQICVILP